jgi:trigger factor
VVRKFKKEVHEQIKGQILLESLEQLAEEHDIAPISPPNLNPNKIEIPDSGPFVYEFEVEVRPQFDLPDYKGLKLKRPVKKFTDDDVVQEEQKVLARYGSLVPKTGAALKGDYIIVDLTTEHQGKKIGEAKEITLRVDDTLAFRDGVANRFGEQTIGARAGDTRVVDIAMTDAVAAEALRGQTVKATLEIKDVKSLRLPELTHEFLHHFDVHSPEQFREMVRTMLDRRLEYTQRQSAREQVLQHIAATATWELPHDMLMRQARKAMSRRVLEMRDAGMTEEEIKGRQRMLERDVLQNTALALKEHFVLQKIAEVEKVEVDDDEIDAEIERIADQAKESPRKVRAQMEREDLIETLAAQIIERKALDLILESAEYEEVPLEAEKGVAAAEAQAVEGQLKDPTAAPPEEKNEADEAKG